MSDRHLKAALGYAKRGFFVLPLEVRGKRPLTLNGYKDATRDVKYIRRWWAETPLANIGIAVGKQFGLIVVDVDGPDGADLLARLEREYGSLPETREATSGRPNRKHLYFEYPETTIRLRRRLRVERTALDILIDGYVVAPPSIHPKTGKRYRWLRSVAPKVAPQTIIKIASGREHFVGEPQSRRRSTGTILEGSRDSELTSIAGAMRRRGCSEQSILAALIQTNVERCNPPLADAQVKKIAASVARYAPVPFEFSEPINDVTLAERFAQIEQGGLRYCPEWKKWLVWDGRHWATDVTLEAQRRVESMVRVLFESLPNIADTTQRESVFKTLNRYSRHRYLEEVLAQARQNVRLVVQPSALDRDGWLFNVSNGVLNLRTGKLRPHSPEALLTKIAPITYDKNAAAPRWERFLQEIMCGDEELISFLQLAVGYSMVGEVREHVLLFCYGGGANGKSTFLEVVHALFGDYAVTIDFETLLYQKYQSSEAKRDIPRLQNARLVTANETPTDARWDERTIKWLTGGDTLAGRKLYQEKVDFTPTHTLWCRANDQPVVRDLSNAFWRRFRLIPFRQKFGDKDQIKDLKAQLLEERAGILNWALAGCLAWQKARTLPSPTRMERATASYREEQDVYGQFIDAVCERVPAAWTETSDLYAAFKNWWMEAHGPRSFVPPMRAFAKGLGKQQGIRPKQRWRNGSKVRGWLGLALAIVVEIE